MAPVVEDLKQAEALTLMWSLDGVLRYLPMAVLHDGERYLIERYRHVVFTPASLARLKDTPQAAWKGLGLGVSRAHPGFRALPGVAEELRGVIRDPGQPDAHGVLPGTIKLDKTFTAQAMITALRERYPVVHIASHFQFRPGNETASFLLLGDGNPFSLDKLRQQTTLFSGVELLTLSACDTAMGSSEANGKEVEGFGVLAQRQGAKAVIATLWPVADVSTKTLMQTMYRQRSTQAGLPKVEALRQAQLALLYGQEQPGTTASAPDRGLKSFHTSDPAATQEWFVPDPRAPYAHSYYWAPFILIGNWK